MTPGQLRHLSAELPKSALETIQQRGGIDYLSTTYVINRLNQVFGIGKWCHLVRNHETREMKGGGLISHCEVTLNIWTAGSRDALRADIVITDVGVCDSTHGSYAQQFDMAHKGAISDGIKRCAKYLGTQFQAPTEKSEKRKAQRQDPRFWCGAARDGVQARADRLGLPGANKKEAAEERSPAPKAQASVSLPGPSPTRQPAPMQYSDGAPPPPGPINEQRQKMSKALHAASAACARHHNMPMTETTGRIKALCYHWAALKRAGEGEPTIWGQVPARVLSKGLDLIADLRAAPSAGAVIDRLAELEASALMEAGR